MEKLKLLIDKKQIASKIAEVARHIDRDYAHKDLVILMVLKGAVCLVADLIRCLTIPNDLEVVQCKSYGPSGTERTSLRTFGLEEVNVTGRHVLIVDDIYDSGYTLLGLMNALQEKEPASVQSLVLLTKKVPHVSHVKPDYSLFDIENHFVVGYGLDYNERYRGLADVYIYNES